MPGNSSSNDGNDNPKSGGGGSGSGGGGGGGGSSSSKKKSGSKKGSTSSSASKPAAGNNSGSNNEVTNNNDALPLARHAAGDNGGGGIHPRTILTAFYGARGERIRHSVHDGCLQMPHDALVDIGIVTTAGGLAGGEPSPDGQTTTTKTYALPGLDSVLRPLVDPKLPSLTVTELMIEKVMVPKSVPVPPSDDDDEDDDDDDDGGGGKEREHPPPKRLAEPEMITVSRVTAKNRVIRRYPEASSDLAPKSGPERIRGGGGDGEEDQPQEGGGIGDPMDIDGDDDGQSEAPTAAEAGSVGGVSVVGGEPPTPLPSENTETEMQAPMVERIPAAASTPPVEGGAGAETAGQPVNEPSTAAADEPTPMDHMPATVPPSSQPSYETTEQTPTDSTTFMSDGNPSAAIAPAPTTATTNEMASFPPLEEIPPAMAQSVAPPPSEETTTINLSTAPSSAVQPTHAAGFPTIGTAAVAPGLTEIPTPSAETATAVELAASAAAVNFHQGQIYEQQQQLINAGVVPMESNFVDPVDHVTVSVASPAVASPAPPPPVATTADLLLAPFTATTAPVTTTQPEDTKPASVPSAPVPTPAPLPEHTAVPADATSGSVPTDVAGTKATADKVSSTDPPPKSAEEASETPLKEENCQEEEVLEDVDVPPARALTSKPDPQWEQHKPAPTDEAVVAADQVTPRPDWYKKDEVADIERSLLPEWFDSSAPHRTPESYLKSREKVVEMSDAMGNRNVTNAMIRRVVVGDAGSLQRLRSFLVHWGIINEDAINDSAPTPASLRSELKTPKRFNDDLCGDLIVAVIQQAKRQKFNDDSMDIDSSSPSFLPLDWDEIAKTVGHGATAEDCQRNFMAAPLKDGSSSALTVSDRPITPDGTQEESKQAPSAASSKGAILKEFIQDLVDRTDRDVLQKVVAAAMEATNGNLQESQAASLLGLQMVRAVEEARGHEVDLAVRLSKLVDTRMQKLENRMVMMDDIEGILEAEKVALELERRDLYTARCRHWFGGA